MGLARHAQLAAQAKDEEDVDVDAISQQFVTGDRYAFIRAACKHPGFAPLINRNNRLMKTDKIVGALEAIEPIMVTSFF